MWKLGDHLSHRYNPDLGPGRVRDLRGRQLVVEFPDAGEILSFAADSDALVPLATDARGADWRARAFRLLHRVDRRLAHRWPFNRLGYSTIVAARRT